MHRRSRFLALTAAPFVASAAPVRAQPLPTLRVGTNPTDPYAQAYYAQDTGLFQNAGLNVEIQTFTGGSAAAAALIGGAIDISVTTPLQLAQAVLEGVPFVIIAAGCITTLRAPAGVLCVLKDVPLRNARDLEGKTVALNTLRTGYHLALNAWLVKGGVDPTRVTTVEMSFSAMAGALARNAIAAAFLTEPFLSSAMVTGNVRVLAYPMAAIAQQYLNTAWFTTTPFAQKNAGAVKRFTSVIYETGAWANTHHPETAAILAKYAKLDPGSVTSMMRADFADRFRPTELQPLLDAGTRFGFLSRPVSAASLVLP